MFGENQELITPLLDKYFKKVTVSQDLFWTIAGARLQLGLPVYKGKK